MATKIPMCRQSLQWHIEPLLYLALTKTHPTNPLSFALPSRTRSKTRGGECKIRPDFDAKNPRQNDKNEAIHEQIDAGFRAQIEAGS